ncbi:MAG: protein kinase [Gammaproteobacteria bacterium]|nr:protein kinase [Gammaproteobacteria bacterium]
MAVNKSQTTSSHIASVVNIPGYKIEDLLGRGGMAVVYLAIQESIGRKVALKVMTPDHTIDDFTERFLREARIVSHLAHPNIVTIYDAGVHQGCHYMSMEYIPGLNLRQARDILSRKQKINIIKQIAQALDFAGKKGFVHRDIKPENIMQHEDGRAILTDFGIARGVAGNTSLTLTGKAIGTPYYMSPEQTKGLKDIDPRSDIYSLGVVLFQYLAGYLPYTGASIVAIGIKHISDPVPFLPKGLAVFQPIIDKCMAKQPEQRYQTAGELFSALDAISDETLDDIDKNAAALKQAGQDYNSATLMVDDEAEIKPASTSSKVKPRTKAQKKSTEPDSSTGNSKQAIPVIDITNTRDYKKLENRNRVILLILLLCITTLAYYQQKEILSFWQVKLEPVARQILTRIENLPITSQVPVNTTNDVEQNVAAKINNTAVQQTITPVSDTEQRIKNENEQIILLRDNLNTHPDNITKIVQIYRNALKINPDEIEAQDGLIALQQWLYNNINDNLKNNTSRARQLLDLLKENYPQEVSTENYQQYEHALNKIENVQTHLKMARVFINTGSFIKPEEANAIKEINAVLKIDPDNETAITLIQEITQKYIEQAKQQQSSGEIAVALQTTQTGLAISNNDPTLLSLQKELSALVKKQQRIQTLLTQAKNQLKSGNLIDPGDNNAYHTYKSILSLQKNNATAENGLKIIESQLISNAMLAIKNNDFDKARQILNQAQSYFQNSSLISQSMKKLELAIDATLPKINHILFSDTAIKSLSEIQHEKIQPGRVLYIGFKYINFPAESTLIQANLLDGSGKIQIAQKPVIVNGDHGDHVFYIELPVEGFGDGTYNLELLLSHKQLIKAPFQVKNKMHE